MDSLFEFRLARQSLVDPCVALVKGKEYPYDRHTAGMIFYNDEGTENGGLIFGGEKDENGQVESYGHLSFDKYMGDQLMTLESSEQEGQTNSELDFIDEPVRRQFRGCLQRIGEHGPLVFEPRRLASRPREQW